MRLHAISFNLNIPSATAIKLRFLQKVLQIKAQEAHRFVPVISLSEFIAPSHLGFIRKITIEGNGPTIQEHVLVDRDKHQVLFIEEFVIDPSGGVHPGSFTALNQVMEENGVWYFAGTYLYPFEPQVDKIDKTSQLFLATYEAMLLFMELEDVDGIYEQLKTLELIK